ncbi:hypothetical protein [Blastococcus brunescens]|uniref:Uncharacterized protein n=1 Tax=Blastococcus brunescens TaxID=1564165 RepID=A0ABZ1B656_9ACTN|nr:hypothetical protein [Blastococcus sp. BMG 8361]WRL64495.1 hypothetical protein U6N30_01230 [Blastococcus sp. BMG 8361]
MDTVDEVLAGYRTPGGLVLDKVIDRLDVHCREFIAHSPSPRWPPRTPRAGRTSPRAAATPASCTSSTSTGCCCPTVPATTGWTACAT